METRKIYSLIDRYVAYVYRCDGQVLPEDDEFFDDLLVESGCGSEDARAVVRRIEELQLGFFDGDRLSLSPMGVMMMEQCDGSVEKFLRRSQQKTVLEMELPEAQLKEIKCAKIQSWIAIGLSMAALIVSIIELVRC